jgi:hypothetical protein
MKNKITIPVHLPDLKEEDFIAATKRRENYALARDLLAEEMFSNHQIFHSCRKLLLTTEQKYI